jgi:hypothetical protein
VPKIPEDTTEWDRYKAGLKELCPSEKSENLSTVETDELNLID